MPLAHAVERPVDAALEQREETFDRVRVDRAAHVFLRGVVHDLMVNADMPRERDVAALGVGVDGRAFGHPLANGTLKVLGVDPGDMTRAYLPAPLHDRDYWSLLRAAAVLAAGM